MINIIASLICYDIWFYLSHTLLHTRKLYPYHKEHHAVGIPTMFDTYTAHFIEGPLQGVGMLIPIRFTLILW